MKQYDINKVTELFNRIKDQNTELNQAIELIDNQQNVAQNFEADLEKIKQAFYAFKNMTEVEHSQLTKAINENAVNDEELSRMRHDLRSKIGAVQSYSELILEELEFDSQNPNKLLSDFCHKLISITSEIIPIISDIKANPAINNEVKPSLDETEHHISNSLNEYFDQTVLIIDDSEYNRDLLQRRLVRSNINVLTAVNGLEGLEVISQNKVDLVLLDIMMPIMNGYETLKRLKSNSNTANIPVLMISAINEIESVVKCIEIGAEDYLPAPFNTTMLNTRVRTCLDKKRLTDKEKEYMQEILNARQRLSSAIESIDDGFAIFDNDHRLIMCNEKFKKLYSSVGKLGGTGFTYEDLINENVDSNAYLLERRHNENGDHDETLENSNLVKMKISRFKSTIPYMEQLSDGTWLEISSHHIPNEGFVSLHKDVTQRHKDEQRLKFIALHDPLTGIANRASFTKHLEIALIKTTEANRKVGLLYLDLDGFKLINDSFGHEKGDEVLKSVAAKMQSHLRTGDMVARLGGDEFAMIFCNISNKDEIMIVANRMIDHIADSIKNDDGVLHIGASIGVALYPDDGKNADTFLARADQAMYSAKKAGKGQCKLYSEL